MRELERAITGPELRRLSTLRRWGKGVLRMVGIRTSARVNKDRLPTPIEPLLQEENGGEISQPEVEKAPNYLFFESLLRPEIIRHEIGKREELLATLTDPTEIARQEVAIGAMKTFPNARLVIDRDDSRVPQIRKLIGLIHDDHQPRLKYATWAPYQAPHVQPHILLADSKTPFEIPLTNVVGASSFDSWEGRGYGGRNNKEIYENGTAVRMPSADVIRHYAERTSEIPPVEYVTAFVQPNGLIFYIVDGGSHRAGAAIKRGNKIIKTQNIKIDLMPFNYFEDEEFQE